jgi:hypothetical protein
VIHAITLLATKRILFRWKRPSIPVNKVKLSTLLAMLTYANEGLDELLQHHIPNLSVELLRQI